MRTLRKSLEKYAKSAPQYVETVPVSVTPAAGFAH
jgi:hypothetical protein